jgi:hypothetical protein
MTRFTTFTREALLIDLRGHCISDDSPSESPHNDFLEVALVHIPSERAILQYIELQAQ